MAEELNWRLSVLDGVSGPSRDIANSLKSVADTLKEVSKSMESFQKETKAAANETKGLGEAAFEFENIKLAAESIIEPLVKLGEFSLDKVMEFEKAGVEALSFKEKTLSSLEALLGSGKEAQAFFSQAAWLGKATPYQTKDVIDQFQRLLSDGFSKTEVPIVFQALGDAAALKGYDVQTMNRMGNALGHMMSNGFGEGSIRMFALDSAGTGFSKEKLYNTLATRMGVDKETVKAKISQGAIGAREGINAILDVIRDTAGGGTLGGGMKLHQDTFEGITSTLKSTFADSFMTREGTPDEIEGWKTIKDVLINMRSALDSTTPAGKALQESLVYAFNAINRALTPLTGPEGLANMKAIILDVSTAVKVFGNVADLAFTVGFSAMEAFLQGIGLLDEKGGAFDDFLDPAKFKVLEDSARSFGKEMGQSLSDIANVAKEVMKAIQWFEGNKSTMDAIGTTLGLAADIAPGVGLAHNAINFNGALHKARMSGYAGDVLGGLVPGMGSMTAMGRMGDKANLDKTPGGGKSGGNAGHTLTTIINVNGAEAKDTKELAAEVSKAQSYTFEDMLRRLATQNGSA